MKQYWMKIKYEDGHQRWELSQGKFRDADASRRAYEPRAKALHFEIVEVKPHEQFEFNYNGKAPTGCDYGIAG